jgi:hypothetical protein
MLTAPDEAENEARCLQIPTMIDYERFLMSFLWMTRQGRIVSAPVITGAEAFIVRGVHGRGPARTTGAASPVQSIQDVYRDTPSLPQHCDNGTRDNEVN